MYLELYLWQFLVLCVEGEITSFCFYRFLRTLPTRTTLNYILRLRFYRFSININSPTTLNSQVINFGIDFLFLKSALRFKRTVTLQPLRVDLFPRPLILGAALWGPRFMWKELLVDLAPRTDAELCFLFLHPVVLNEAQMCLVVRRPQVRASFLLLSPLWVPSNNQLLASTYNLLS